MTFPKDTARDCTRAWEAMPWVLQESASQEQRDWLMSHVAECDSCRAEYAQQSRLRLALSLPSDIPIDANVGLKRLLGRLDRPDIEETSARRRPTGWLTRALVAAVLIQAIGISVLGMKVLSAGDHSPYRTLSQEAAPAAPGSIHVVPDDGMTMATWDGLLHRLHLQVIGGPNEVGAYTVIPADPANPASNANALQQLRATQGIRLAEPVAATP